MTATSATLEASAAPAVAVSEEVSPVPLALPLQAVLAALFIAIAVIGTYNAWTYPAEIGYDAVANMQYADGLIHHGQLPTVANGSEYYTPPGYYAVAGAALWVGEKLGMAHPAQLAQQLNVLFVLATAALLLFIARLLFPRRPLVWVGSVGFFCFLPVVPKVAAMFHPETLNMLVATAAAAIATWMIARRRYGKRDFAALAVVLGLAQLVRSSGIFTFGAIALSLVIAIFVENVDRRQALRALAIGAAALLLLVTPWYARQAIKYHTWAPISVVPGFAQTMLHPGNSVVSQEGGLTHYFSFPVVEMYNWPTRPHYINEAIPTTYVEIWDDWLGWWAWVPDKQPSGHTLRVMRDQVLIGAIPTLLAIGGWGWLLIEGLRRRRALLPVALLPVIAVAGYLYRSYAAASVDGDTLKAAYLLITAPMWALGFGVAFERLTRNRWALIGLATLFLAFAGLELRFIVYGMRAGGGL